MKEVGWGSTEEKNSLDEMTAFSSNLDLTLSTDRALKAMYLGVKDGSCEESESDPEASEESEESDMSESISV